MNSAEPSIAPRAERPPSWGWTFACVLALGLALRSWEAIQSSLWLDELHTLHHAGHGSPGAVLESVRQDHHTPLFFLAVHFVGGWGDLPWVRFLTVLTSLALIPLTLRFVRGASQVAGVGLLAAILAASLPYPVHYGAELRPYAWVAVFSALACGIAFKEGGSKFLRFLGFAVVVYLGLQTHRVMAVSVAGIGAARLVVRRPGMLELKWLILAGVVAVLPFVPWYLSFAEQATGARMDHQESIGGFRLRPAIKREAMNLPIRVVAPLGGFLLEPWAKVTKLGLVGLAGGFGAACLAALVARLRGVRATLPPALMACFVFAPITFLMTAALSFFTWDRLPLQYFAGSVWVIPLVFAVPLAWVPSPRVRGVLIAWMGGSSLVLGICLAGGRSRPMIREGVEMLQVWEQEWIDDNPDSEFQPLYTAVLSQPGEVFPDRLPYAAYAPQLEPLEPEDVPRPGDPDFGRPLLVYRRVLDLSHEKWTPISDGRIIQREHRLDPYTTVFLFVPLP